MLSRLSLSSDQYQLKAGTEPFTWRGTLSWSLYGRALYHGLENARQVVRDRRSVGANTVCCSLMLSWGFPFSPATPGFWDMLTPFVRMCAEENMRVCFTVFADTRSIMPDQGAQLAHWQRVWTHLASEPNVTLLLANQAGHPSQAINIHAFDKPQSVGGFPALLAVIDNPFEDNPVTQPVWDFGFFCSKRNEPNWYMEAGCVSMWTAVNDQARKAVVLFEPAPCGRLDVWTDPGKWRQFGRSLCFKGTCGANFYSDFDARSEVYPSGVVRNCAVEFLGNIPNP